MKPNVYQASSCVEFLTATLQYRTQRNPRYSLRSLAKALKLSNVGHLSMVINRKRPISANLAIKICDHFKLDEQQKQYFILLTLYERSKSESERALFQGALHNLKVGESYTTFKTDLLTCISDWVHFVIMEMVYLPDFKPDALDMSRRIGRGVSPLKIEEAMHRLLRVGLLRWNHKGRLEKRELRLSSPAENHSRALREVHKQFMSQALEAVEDQSVERRDISSHVVVTNQRKIKVAKKMIRDFRLKLGSFLEDEHGDTVYTLCVQLFENLASETGKDSKS